MTSIFVLVVSLNKEDDTYGPSYKLAAPDIYTDETYPIFESRAAAESFIAANIHDKIYKTEVLELQMFNRKKIPVIREFIAFLTTLQKKRPKE